MSHFITVDLPDGGRRLNSGMSIITLSSLRRSGFDIYEAYHAVSCHGGISGNGGIKAVDPSVARKALARAFGWAAALREAFPHEFEQANPNWPDLLSVAPLSDQRL